MSRRAAFFWARTAVEAAVAALLLALFEPPSHLGSVSPVPGLVLGAATGYCLVVVLARRRPAIGRVPRSRRRIVAGKAVVLALGSTCEEVIWRWFGVGALASRVGLAAALAATTVAFALAHAGHAPRAFAVHLVTGAAFGSVFAVTGSLAAAALAHGTYNTTVLVAVESRRNRTASLGLRSA